MLSLELNTQSFLILKPLVGSESLCSLLASEKEASLS